MGMFSSFFNPGSAYQDAQGELQKYFEQAQKYEQPFIDNGQAAYGGLSDAMKSLLNPAELQNQWTQSYQTSPAAQQAQDMARQQGLDAASSMGMLGSSSALNALQQGTSQIGLNDRQNYLNDLMQKYMAGTGIGQNIYGVGANAANTMSSNAMNMGQNSAQMAYGAGSAGGNLLGSLGGIAGGLFGGPLGGMMGSSLGGMLSQGGGGLPVGSSWKVGG